MSQYQFLHTGSYVKIIMHDIPEKPGVLAKIFDILAANNINVLTVKHSMHSSQQGDIAFSVSKSDSEKAIQLMRDNMKHIEAKDISYKQDLALVFISGDKIENLPRFASDILRAFSAYDVDFDSLSLAVEGITCILPENQFKKAVHAFNKMFVDEPIISPV